jgi:hypothetical protein
MTSTNPADASYPAAARGRRKLPVWQAVVGGAVAATVINLIVLFIGDAAGAALTVKLNDKSEEIVAGGVIFGSIVPLAVGVTVTLLLARWKPVLLRVGQIVGGGVALLSAIGPLTADTDGGTAATLVVMHVVVGLFAVVTLEAVRRSQA